MQQITILSRLRFIALAAVISLLAACSKEKPMPMPDDSPDQSTYITLVRAGVPEGPNSINTTDEDFVKELRLVMVGTENPSIVFNKILRFNDMGSNPNGYSFASVPEKIKAGSYNMYYIANESTYPALTAKLDALGNESEIANLIADFDKDFKPDAAAGKGLLMTASKGAVVMQPNMPFTNPNRVQVELIRTVAKLSVLFDRPSGSVAEQKKLYISNVSMGMMPTQFYLFPHSSALFAGELTLQHDYSNELQGNPLAIPFAKKISRYVSEYKDGANPLKLHITVKQENTAVERVKTIDLAGDDAGMFRRNTHHDYKFTLKDWSDIAVEFEVGDWDADNSWAYVSQYFNLWVSDKNMPSGQEVKLTLYTSQPTELLPNNHEVTLIPLNGTTINGSAEPVSFKEKAYGAYAEYTVLPSSSMPALEVQYAKKTEIRLPLEP